MLLTCGNEKKYFSTTAKGSLREKFREMWGSKPTQKISFEKQVRYKDGKKAQEVNSEDKRFPGKR